jgi:hypothetical protein
MDESEFQFETVSDSKESFQATIKC